MNQEFLKLLTPQNRENLFPLIQRSVDAFHFVCLYNSYKEIEYVNENLCTVTGYSLKDLKMNEYNCATNLINENEFNNMWTSLNEYGVWNGHLHFMKKGGESLWLDVSAFAFIDENNNISQAGLIGSDITEYKKAIEVKQMFLANMSHELRTPLHGILSLTSLLKDTLLSEEQMSFIKHLQKAGNVLSKMVDDLIDLNKIETKQLKLEKSEFCPAEILDDISMLFNDRIKSKNLEYNLKINENIPGKIVGDPFRLKQILIQLIENSLNFTNEGSISIESGLVYEGANNYIILFKITDTGIGIPRDKLDFILEKFNQAKMDFSRPIGGAGLGLTIAKYIIEIQGGRFSIYSREGEGTEVEFSLNYGKPTSGYYNEEAAEAGHKRQVKVLIAEDIELTQIIFKKQMQKLGYGYDFAENGKEAIEILESGKFDIILMDMHMPVMNGFEAIDHIRSKMEEPFKSIPIISVSANVINDAPDLCIKAGADDYIPKPFELNELREKIEYLVYKNKNTNK